jgi:hypothetical protein
MPTPAPNPFIDSGILHLDRFVDRAPVHRAAWLDARGVA